MYPFQLLIYEWKRAKAQLEDSFGPKEESNILPLHSAKTDIASAAVKWQNKKAFVQGAFRSIGLIAANAHNAEKQ